MEDALKRQIALLVVQGEEAVSIVQGEMPLLYIATHADSYLVQQVAKAVNFLRSGCPSVQMMWIHINVRETIIMLFKTVQHAECFEFSERVIAFPGTAGGGGVETMIITRRLHNSESSL